MPTCRKQPKKSNKEMFCVNQKFVNVIHFKFGDLLYWRTPANSFIQILGTGLSVPSAECFVEVKDIVIDPLPEHFNENISACGTKNVSLVQHLSPVKTFTPLLLVDPTKQSPMRD